MSSSALRTAAGSPKCAWEDRARLPFFTPGVFTLLGHRNKIFSRLSFVCVWWEHLRSTLGKFKVESAVLLPTVTMMYIRSPEFILSIVYHFIIYALISFYFLSLFSFFFSSSFFSSSFFLLFFFSAVCLARPPAEHSRPPFPGCRGLLYPCVLASEISGALGGQSSRGHALISWTQKGGAWKVNSWVVLRFEPYWSMQKEKILEVQNLLLE